MTIPQKIVRNILGDKVGRNKWKPTRGDYDIDSKQYDIDYGDCQVCGIKLHSPSNRKDGLCNSCRRDAIDELKRS